MTTGVKSSKTSNVQPVSMVVNAVRQILNSSKIQYGKRPYRVCLSYSEPGVRPHCVCQVVNVEFAQAGVKHRSALSPILQLPIMCALNSLKASSESLASGFVNVPLSVCNLADAQTLFERWWTPSKSATNEIPYEWVDNLPIFSLACHHTSTRSP